ncbi:DUF6547 family protein [Actomonas aquatica]|uniref:DUF6547 family protein n=1 Tax=Actomonas aquatica TaxID=2866162 RepID=A0ABZ1C2R4_9BACT|nr:DUF6547 family protein [Opitutus sp. WL0086]WRQ85533.1 DUF6547 family protein [Opitutus sp. WL0086]
MSDPALQLYKSVVDGFAQIHEGVHRVWVTERGFPDLPENREKNQFLSELRPDQKEVLVQMLEEARDGGIHDTLVYLHDRMAIEGLRLREGGIEMAHEPFDTQLYYDWVCRRAGDNWPDE